MPQQIFRYLASPTDMQQFFISGASIGRGACALGLVLLLWNIAEWLSEETFVGTLSECVVYRTHDSTVAVYSEGILMVRCRATYTKNGALEMAELNSKLPGNFQIGTEPLRTSIKVAALDPKKARFAAFTRAWDDTLAKVLFFEFVGVLFLLNGRNGK